MELIPFASFEPTRAGRWKSSKMLLLDVHG